MQCIICQLCLNNMNALCQHSYIYMNIYIYILTYLYHPVGRYYLLLFYRAVEKCRLRFLFLSQLTLHHTNYLICTRNCPKSQDHAKIWKSFPYLQLIGVKITNGSRKDKVVISAVRGIQAKFHEGGVCVCVCV